jgi:FixJ family two-component response regulator
VKTLVLNDQPLLHMALDLVLEDAKSDVAHFADAGAFVRALGADTRCLIIDLATKGLDLEKVLDAVKARATDAGVVLLGEKRALVSEPRTVLWTKEPYTDRERIAAFVKSLIHPRG